MTGLGWQVIFIHISCQTPRRNLMHWHERCGVLSGSQTCCTPMQACHALPVIQFSALFTLPSSVTRLFWAKEPYNSAFCLVIMQLDSTWLDIKFMLWTLVSNLRWQVCFTLITCPASTYSKGWSWNISSCTGQAGAATWTTTSSCRNGTGWGRSGREAQVQRVGIYV